jgi:hypothetical protein
MEKQTTLKGVFSLGNVYSFQKLKKNVIQLTFKLSQHHLNLKFGNKPSRVHRLISNGQRKFGNISNRSFWKNIKCNDYHFFYSLKYVHFIYYLPEDIDQKIIKQFQIRVMLTLGIRVSINDTHSTQQ